MIHQRVLTGITPSGTPHLGNYLGMIRPAIETSRKKEFDSFFFLADLHALIKCCGQPERIHRSTLEIAATWLAVGLDPEQVTFYRQSDIPEIPQLCWMLTCVTSKGLVNRAHAYKAAVDKNNESGEEPDAGVSAGLYMYPVLMAADILMFNSKYIPVGRDQIQHVEMARDIAERFNYYYGNGKDLLVLPEAQIDENVATLPGLDGRKMSKSYNNTIPLFAEPEEMRRLINSIVTDIKEPGEPKNTQGSALFEIYQAVASKEETQAMRQAYAQGIAWGDAKSILFERVEQEISPMRERYKSLMARPEQIEEILLAGSARARKIATPLLAKLRDAVGLRALTIPVRQGVLDNGKNTKQMQAQVALFKQYRENDGQFYFKLVADDGKGDVLLQSIGFASGKEAGQCIGALRSNPSVALGQHLDKLVFPDGVEQQQVLDALLKMKRVQESQTKK